MAKKNSSPAQRAWSLLRLALLWARKGGVLKRRMMVELRSLWPKYLKTLGHNNAYRDQIHYGERELSFDKTPIFHVKMHRPASMRFLLPCITRQIDFDYDFDENDSDCDYDGVSCGYDYEKSGLSKGREGYEDGVKEEEEEIDMKAEEFIAKFYEQIKLQRQISYLEYKESARSKEES